MIAGALVVALALGAWPPLTIEGRPHIESGLREWAQAEIEHFKRKWQITPRAEACLVALRWRESIRGQAALAESMLVTDGPNPALSASVAALRAAEKALSKYLRDNCPEGSEQLSDALAAYGWLESNPVSPPDDGELLRLVVRAWWGYVAPAPKTKSQTIRAVALFGGVVGLATMPPSSIVARLRAR